MALLFMDGFDHYDTSASNVSAQMLGSGDYVSSSGMERTSETAYGDGLGSALVFNDDSSYWQTKSLPIAGNRVIIGFHVRRTSQQSSNNATAWQRLVGINNHFNLSMNMSKPNRVYAKRGSFNYQGIELGGAGDYFTLEQNVTHHIVCIVDQSTSATGRVQVYKDGIKVIDIQNVATVSAHNANVNIIAGQVQSSNYWERLAYDNLFVMDGGGAENNDYPGILRVLPLLPNGDDAIAAGATALNGGSHFEEVDDEFLNGADSTYTSTATAGDQNLYDVPVASTLWADADQVIALQVKQNVGTNAPTNSEIAAVINDGTNTAQGDTHTATTVAHKLFSHIFDAAPDGGAWDLATLDALKVGHKHISSS
ncbi:hypothetical protein [Paraferrimonas sedimenticola]|uniref:Uncharacterized protein n=1 Tax=Paraferrimonas sedimenticola TaxID=375674 RepID=A0AA37RUT7_9GAMM|nr:hypothetical protein [Paraferrimonas sedimenticola]GLP95282.1 hypothetical protein GCM10007895_05880 [Paraferrimonas sedimenticola]